MNDSEIKETESRLAGILADFMGGDAETFKDAGIDGDGVVVRLIIAGRMVEINATITDVTESLVS